MPGYIKERARVVRATRKFFDEAGFTEVATAVRIAAPAPEEHIDCPASGDKFLRASPELQMKKLLALGSGPIYQIGPCFREGEIGSRHREEFTMLEWYRPGADYTAIRRDLENLWISLAGPADFSVITVREAYRTLAGWDPWTSWDQDRFDFDMASKIEPSLPSGPVFLTDYPREAASLSKLRGDVAERWEFYFNRIELANAFTELVDAAEQRRRFEKARANRAAFGESDYPLDEEFLALLPMMPPSGGAALGMERLVMALAGLNDISAVAPIG